MKTNPLSTFPGGSVELQLMAAAFGQAARELRLKRGLTPEVLALRAGISLSQLRRIEAGRVNPLLPTVLGLGRSLGDELYDRVEQLYPSARLLTPRTDN